MTTPNPKAPPSGLTPILLVSDAHAAIDFYGRAFAAVEIARIAAPDGARLLQVRMQLFGTILIFMDEFPELAGEVSRFKTPDSLGGTTVTLHLQVPDAQAIWAQALYSGATSVIPLAQQFWGELYGRLKDPFGHEWTIAQMLENFKTSDVEAAAIAVFESKNAGL
jgi:PhnB protein